MPYRCCAYSGTSAPKPSAAAPNRKLIRFITPKPRPLSSRYGTNGAASVRECRTKMNPKSAATASQPRNTGLYSGTCPLPR